MPNNPEFSSFNSAEESFNNSPWAEESDMNVRSETEIDSTESEKKEANLADRIRNEMTLQEIEKLDIQKISDEEFAAVEERIKQFDETGNAGPITETELPPKVQELKKKAVNNIAFKSALDNLVKDIKEIAKSPKRIIAALGLTAMIAAAGIGGYKVGKEFLSNGADNGIKNEQTTDDEIESLTGYDKLDRRIDGSFEQDDNLGCYESKGKVSDDAVANPDLVLQEMGIDPATATPEQRGVASEYITYSMKYPTAFQSIAYKLEGFENLSLNEAEDKISKMSDEEKANLKKQIQEKYENSEYSEEVGQGMYRNHGVAERADGRHSYFVESDLTGKNILVRETKLEDGTTVITREKEDCSNMLTEIEYRHPDGTTTVIAINTPDEKPGKGDNPTPDNPPQPKNQKEANENSGAAQGIVTPEKQERQITPEPSADEAHSYNQGTNTYDYTPKEQAEKIGYEVNKTDNATVGTGEVTGNTPSADGSGDTIEKNLNEATGVEGANYNQGF